MKKQNLNLSSFFIIILFTLSYAHSSEKSTLKGKAKVIDGDTIEINKENPYVYSLITQFLKYSKISDLNEKKLKVVFKYKNKMNLNQNVAI